MDDSHNAVSTNSGLDRFYSNMYLVQSSVEQQNSVKFHGNHGSPFIQTVCKSLAKKWRTDNLMHIFANDVTECLYQWKPTTEGKIWNLAPGFRMLGNSTSHQEKSLFLTLTSARPDSWPAIHPQSKLSA